MAYKRRTIVPMRPVWSAVDMDVAGFLAPAWWINSVDIVPNASAVYKLQWYDWVAFVALLLVKKTWFASQYSLKISSNITHPARNRVLDKQSTKTLTNVRTKSVLSVCVFKMTSFPLVSKDIHFSSISTVPPWLLNQPSVVLSLSNIAKSETNPDVFKSKFLEICDELQGIFSDIHRWFQNE